MFCARMQINRILNIVLCITITITTNDHILRDLIESGE